MAQVETVRGPIDTARLDWFSPEQIARFAPSWHYGHLFNDVLPALRERGVSETQLETMLVGNPRRYFSGPSPQGS